MKRRRPRARRRRCRLRPTDYRVYRLLTEILDGETFRPTKQVYVARRVGVSRSAVAHGFQRLEALGYLERAPSGYRTEVASFRLVARVSGGMR